MRKCKLIQGYDDQLLKIQMQRSHNSQPINENMKINRSMLTDSQEKSFRCASVNES